MSTHLAIVPKSLRATSPPSSQQPFLARDLNAGTSLHQPSSSALSEADIDRFATLFSPATPPATPTVAATEWTQFVASTRPAGRPRKSTQSSADTDFGAFVSVPPSQDPLSHDNEHGGHSSFVSQSHVSSFDTSNHSLAYFDQFATNAKTAAERNKREVLDELLHHQDDPMYFLNTHPTATATASPHRILSPSPPSLFSTSTYSVTSTDDALAEALASDMHNPRLIRVEHGGCVKVAPSPSRSRLPLPPRLSGDASPPSMSTPSRSSTPLPTVSSSPPPSSSLTSVSTLGSGSSPHPAHATLSRISSSLVSLLPSTRSRSRAQSFATTAPSSAPSTLARSHTPLPALTHGSPFESIPYIPPTGAPGFAGDRAWDRGFSEALIEDKKRGLIDPIGLGLSIGTETETGAGSGTGTEMTTHIRNNKAKGVTLVGRREGTVGVLTDTMADLIRPYFPALTKLPRQWTLLYSLDQHGISLNTLYTRCQPRIPSRAHPNPPKGGLLVIRDANDAVFGAWLSEGIWIEKGGYYGSGESFLWRYNSPPQGDLDCDQERQGRLDVYKWTGVNAYVALCEPGFISFGGGDGHYGLYLDASLLDGSSAACPTFGNPPLCLDEGRNGMTKTKTKREVSFECVGLEVWGIGSE